jgi:DNA-directed RNA polymerase specialized sigma24 family protein
MSERDWLAGRFEDNRDRLRGVAYRMLGSAAEADDAVQETWLRVSRSGLDATELRLAPDLAALVATRRHPAQGSHPAQESHPC